MVMMLTSPSSGGIRGIIQLSILRAIEKQFLGDMQIQSFFDLVVGTRYDFSPFMDVSSHFRQTSCLYINRHREKETSIQDDRDAYMDDVTAREGSLP